MPYGLGGPGVIPKSSCKDCALITSRFEREVLRGYLLGLRAHLGLKSRRKKNMPVDLPLVVIRDGQEEEVSVPIGEHPIMVYFPIFHPPRVITGDAGDGVRFRYLAIFGFGKPIQQVKEDFGADDVKVNMTSTPVAFARMLAKIGWGFAIASGHESKLAPELRDAILYDPARIGDWVGTYTDPPNAQMEAGGHMIEIRADNNTGYLMCDIQLFAGTNTPKYGVALGKL